MQRFAAGASQVAWWLDRSQASLTRAPSSGFWSWTMAVGSHPAWSICSFPLHRFVHFLNLSTQKELRNEDGLLVNQFQSWHSHSGIRSVIFYVRYSLLYKPIKFLNSFYQSSLIIQVTQNWIQSVADVINKFQSNVVTEY